MLKHNVILEKESHRYINTVTGREYGSVSKFLDEFKNKFDAPMISRIMANSKLKKMGVPFTTEDVDREQKVLLNQWATKNKKSTDDGTAMHEAIENYLLDGSYTPEHRDMISRMKSEIFDLYNKIHTEVIIPSEKWGICGTSDIVAEVGNGVYDIIDWKTNSEIHFFDKYKKSMKGPVEHFSDCNYNHYAMQLSTYGRILEDEWGIKIRRIMLVHIPLDNPKGYKIIPINFLKTDVGNMLSHVGVKNLKQTVDVILDRQEK